MRAQCIELSKQLLHLLEYLVVDSDEPYVSMVRHLVPFTAFLELFGEIVAGKSEIREKLDALVAMEKLQVFLYEMRSRNSLAVKLERIADVFVQHAKSVMRPLGTYADISDGSVRDDVNSHSISDRYPPR